MQNIVIIGNGISGITTARFLRKTNPKCNITVISSESDHFYSRTALMYVYMGHMRYQDTKPYEDRFWAENRIALLRNYVQNIDTTQQILTFENNQTMPYDALVLAVGSRPRRFGWKGQHLNGVQGLYGLADLALMEENTKNIRQGVVVGGGLIGVEMAEMLHSRHIETTFLVREPSYMSAILPPEESEMVNVEIRRNGIDLRLNAELSEITERENGRVGGIKTTSGEAISAQFVGLTIGVEPNISFLENTPIACNRGVLINHRFQTNIPNVYAVGDCAEFATPYPEQRPIEQLWYTGRMQGEVLGQILGGKNLKYEKDVFFNSAKFFDLEYQVYGQISAKLQAYEKTVFWQNAAKTKAIRINYHAETNQVLGFNLTGVRYRQDVCSAWIKSKKEVGFVLKNLKEANFDPEFFRKHEREINRVFQDSLR